MKTHHTVTVAMLAGFGLGAVAIQGLHAQAKPLAYLITERVEVINEAVEKEYLLKVAQFVQASGGKYLVRGGQVIALDGKAPQRFIVIVFDSVEKAQAQYNSAAWKELTPLREKAAKNRTFIAEGVTN